MPNCFMLSRKDDAQHRAVPFSQIDDEMRQHFGAEPNSERYYLGWYDSVGLAIALGISFEKMKAETFAKSGKDFLAVIDWLDANFTSDAWYAPRSITG